MLKAVTATYMITKAAETAAMPVQHQLFKHLLDVTARLSLRLRHIDQHLCITQRQYMRLRNRLLFTRSLRQHILHLHQHTHNQYKRLRRIAHLGQQHSLTEHVCKQALALAILQARHIQSLAILLALHIPHQAKQLAAHQAQQLRLTEHVCRRALASLQHRLSHLGLHIARRLVLIRAILTQVTLTRATLILHTHRQARQRTAHLAQRLRLTEHVCKADLAHLLVHLLKFTLVMRQQALHRLTDMALAAHIHRQIICRSASKGFP